MYEFLGLQPPTKKKKKTSSEREKKQNNYDRNICECVFRKFWREERPWLNTLKKKTK